MTRKLLLLGTVVGALGFLTPGYANEIWNFNSPVSPPALGTTHDYPGTLGTIITATAFGAPGTQLFGKGLGGDENGVGLTNDSALAFKILDFDLYAVGFPIGVFVLGGAKHVHVSFRYVDQYAHDVRACHRQEGDAGILDDVSVLWSGIHRLHCSAQS